jgi:hypothetical protein
VGNWERQLVLPWLRTPAGVRWYETVLTLPTVTAVLLKGLRLWGKERFDSAMSDNPQAVCIEKVRSS